MTPKTLSICMGSACFARGNAENLAFIEKYVKDHGLEARINVVGSRCEGLCADGPNIFIDKKLYKAMTPEKLKTVLDEVFK